MSEKYSKADLRHIAEDMIEDLRECEDGTVTTTGRLARDYGYDDMETFDLFDLHDALMKCKDYIKGFGGHTMACRSFC